MTTSPDIPRGWHSRGYLPHFDGTEIAQTVTFRLADAIEYIENNPVKAGLCTRPEDWEFSSARIRLAAKCGQDARAPGSAPGIRQ